MSDTLCERVLELAAKHNLGSQVHIWDAVQRATYEIKGCIDVLYTYRKVVALGIYTYN